MNIFLQMKKIVSVLLIGSILTGTVSAKTINVPNGLGAVHTYTPWDKIDWGYNCLKLKKKMQSLDAISDTNGIVTYGDYWAGALTTTFGNVGDLLIVVQNDNTIYPVIIADIKSQGNNKCNKWGHQWGKCVIEFEILSKYRKSLYGTSGGYISDKLAKPIDKIINLGSVFKDETYLFDFNQACIDNGFEGYEMLISPYETRQIISVQQMTNISCGDVQETFSFFNSESMFNIVAVNKEEMKKPYGDLEKYYERCYEAYNRIYAR
jgi:hypothetical protein